MAKGHAAIQVCDVGALNRDDLAASSGSSAYSKTDTVAGATMGSFILVVLAVAAAKRKRWWSMVFIKKPTVTFPKDECFMDVPAMLDVDHSKALGAATLVLW